MESFFEQYRNKAEAKSDLPFQEADWVKLEKKLNEQGKKSLPSFFWPVIAGTLLFASFVFFYKTHEPSTLSDAPLIRVVYETIHDTLFRRDTLYLDKAYSSIQWIEKKTGEDRPETFRLLNDLTAVNANLRNSLKENQIKLDAALEKLKLFNTPTNEKIPENGSTTAWPYNNASTASLFERANTPPVAPEVPLAVSLPLAGDTLNVWKKFLSSFRPARLDIGGLAGLPFLSNPGIRNKPGYLIGAKMSMALESHFEVQLGLAYTKLFYEGLKMDDRLGIPFQQAPINDLLFSKAEVIRPVFQLDLGLFYSFLNHKRIVPKIGIGVGFVMPQVSEVSYDFRSPSSPVEWTLDNRFKPNIKNPYSLQWHGALNYKINSHWSWSVQSVLHQKLRKGDLLSKRVDLSAAVWYRLY